MQPHHTPCVFLPYPGGCLRPKRADDTELMQSWAAINNPENWIYLARRLPQSLPSQRAWLEEEPGANQITLIIEHEGTAIGTIGAGSIDWINRTAVTGALIWDQAYWNRGIGHKAKMILLNYLFNQLNLRLIESRVLGFNGRSAKYSDKCGYREDARLPERFQLGDRLVDEIVMSVTKELWLPKWQAFQDEHQLETLDEMLERHKRINR